MSWKYTSCTPRDLSSSKDSLQTKFGFSNFSSSSSDRWSARVPADSKFYRSPVELIEYSPIWAKNSTGENTSSVPKLKERYNISTEPRREIKAYRKAETKDLGGSPSGRQYGRTLTTLRLAETDGESSRFRRRFDKHSDPEKTKSGVSPLEIRKILHMPTAATKLFNEKYRSDSTPASKEPTEKEKLATNEECGNEENTITVVTRGTSPSPTAPTVYLRSKRSDYGLEKRVAKPRRTSSTAEKGIQTERDIPLSIYSAYGETGSRSLWSPYGGTCCNSKFANRSNFGGGSRLELNECRRSTSREDSGNPTTPESPSHKIFAAKPPTSVKMAPVSPVTESEKNIVGRNSSPINIRSSLKLDCAKTDLARNPNSPTRLSSLLQCNIANTESTGKQTGGQSPKVTINHCPDVDEVSSFSESSEEETSSDEGTDERAPLAITVKKSVTNFLQNIPNHISQNQSKANLNQKLNNHSPQKINFRKIESGEKAWWLETSDQASDAITRIKSTRSVVSQDIESSEPRSFNNLLSPPYLLNRQFSKDKDWLKESSEELNKANEGFSPREELSPRNGAPSGQTLINGNTLIKTHTVGNNNSSVEVGNDNFNVTVPIRIRDYSRSPENSLTKEVNHKMKFGQPTGEHPTDYQRECSTKDISPKLQHGLGISLEDQDILETGNMSGMISNAKAGLVKSKTKLDIKKSSSRELSPKISDNKSEIEVYWKELADSLNRPLRLCDLDFTDLNSDDDTDILGKNKLNGEVPPPPPMLIFPVPALTSTKNLNLPTPTATARTKAPAPPPAPQVFKNKKTVKLFWKEVKEEPAIQLKIPDGANFIWDELIKVKVDTQKLEYLFESRAKDLISKKQQEQNKNKEVIVLDPKRSNVINIGMTKLPPPRAIKTAILKMDATVVNKEGIEKLLTMLPSEEEKIRIQEAQNANPETPLGSAEQFLLTLASITELEARLRLWAFKLNFENYEKEICEPLMDLKHGMEMLRTNKTFRGILSTLLSIGNFLNGYDVKGFQIEYLSKVPEVKDTVHKHSLLHHLCLIVMEKFPDSADLYSEIGAVTRASKVDFDELATNIRKVEEECKLSWNYLKMIAKHEGHTTMKVKMSDFLADCAERIIVIGIVHKRIMSRYQKFAFWLGIPMNRISTTRPNEIFKIISEFALEYRTTRDRILQQIKKMNREKSRTRGHFSADSNDSTMRKMNSKEAKDDAKLKQLLQDETTYPDSLMNTSTWRRQRRDTKNLLQEAKNNDDEILDALIKTANQVVSPRLKERRRSKIYGKYCK